jgi:hypothetical protein
VVVGVRVDKELYLRFKSVSKRIFGSVCNPIESFMAAVVGLAENGVNPSNTVRIGKIVIERNLRERRKQGVGDLVGLRGVEVVGEVLLRSLRVRWWFLSLRLGLLLSVGWIILVGVLRI